MPKTDVSQTDEKITYYDDKSHNYQDFWIGRDYEHNSEVIALSRLLKGRHYGVAMDYGGGYGRLTPALMEFADKLILADPSTKQLNIGKEFLKGKEGVEFALIAKKDQVPAADESLDLLVMVRVSHHLLDPNNTFREIHRVLKPGGEAVIEIANEAHFVNRMRYLKHLKGVPKDPVPVGVRANGIEDSTPFVNHNPVTIRKLLNLNGLTIEAKLSVSNLRKKYLKEHLSMERMLAIEKFFQGKLSWMDFGPSIFILVRKD